MTKKYSISLIVLLISLFLLAGFGSIKEKSSNVLVIMNSSSPAYCKGKEYIIPYLEHFGLPYSTIDISGEKLPEKLEKYALIIVAHKQIEMGIDKSIKSSILKAVNSGTGLVSFDFHFTLQKKYLPVEYNMKNEIKFSKSWHYISSAHKPSEKLTLFREMLLPKIANQNNVILFGDSQHPLLIASQKGKGRIVTWTNMDCMQTFVLGPLGGLDDCLWRSFVWAAKKPFAFRGLPPIVSLRVDDVAGRGQIWGKSPLYWVKIANKYGFKPFLALFIYNLNPEAIKELRSYLLNGKATASPHAFGRPPRTDEMPNYQDYFTKEVDPGYYKGYYYYKKGLNYRAEEYDEFIYFNWAKQSAWSDREAQRGLQAVDEWYTRHQPLPMSKYLVPHWYELGTNVIPHIVDKWGIEFVGIVIEPGAYYSSYTPWLKAAPFRLYEEPGASAFSKTQRAAHSVYYADFIKYGKRKLFNSITEIRDITGYEWEPDNDVEASATRGIRQLKRALNSMALAVLFTHETDYISKVRPENWDLLLKKITNGIADYNPIFMSMDSALSYVRATKTSKFVYYDLTLDKKGIKAHFSGKADVPTHFYLFTEDVNGIHSHLINIPDFNSSITIKEKIDAK